jgi:hypothetical protein
VLEHAVHQHVGAEGEAFDLGGDGPVGVAVGLEQGDQVDEQGLGDGLGASAASPVRPLTSAAPARSMV